LFGWVEGPEAKTEHEYAKMLTFKDDQTLYKVGVLILDVSVYPILSYWFGTSFSFSEK